MNDLPVEQPKGSVPYALCKCAFCLGGQAHRTTHKLYQRISDRLLVPESLRDEDRVKQWACLTCGHTVEEPHTWTRRESKEYADEFGYEIDPNTGQYLPPE